MRRAQLDMRDRLGFAWSKMASRRAFGREEEERALFAPWALASQAARPRPAPDYPRHIPRPLDRAPSPCAPHAALRSLFGQSMAVVTLCGFPDESVHRLHSSGSSQPFLEVGQGIASIARSKAVYSAIDSHALGGLKPRMVFANSTARQTDVSEQKIALSTSVEPEVARPLRQEHIRFRRFQLERILPIVAKCSSAMALHLT